MFNPAHPGELIRETLEALREENGGKFTVGEVAEGLGTTRKTLSAIINGKQGVTPEMALRLADAAEILEPEDLRELFAGKITSMNLLYQERPGSGQ